MEQTKAYFPISPNCLTALECGHFFQQEYLVKQKPEDEDILTSIQTHIGRFGHVVLAIYVAALKEAKMQADDDIFYRAFDEAWEKNTYIPEPYYIDLKESLYRFAQNNPINPEKVWNVERKIALDWDLKERDWKGNGVFLRGIIDRIDVYPENNTAIIIDYKYFLPTEGILKASYQTKIYPFLTYCLNPYLKEYILVYRSIKTNQKISFKFSRDEILLMEKPLRDLSIGLAKKVVNPDVKWVARAGINCPYCNYECPLIKIGIEPIKTTDQAIKVGSKLFALEKEVKKLDAELKTYVQTTKEEIDIGAGIYKMVPTSTLRGLKADKLADFALEKGIDLKVVLSPNTQKIKKLEDGEIKDAILKMGKLTPGSKFTFVVSTHEPDEEKENEE